MGSLSLPAVFWNTPEDDQPQKAIVFVEDGDVIHIRRADGLDVVLLAIEFVELARFVADEIEEYERLNPEEVTYAPDKDEVPF